jgi:predicted nucleic acid-binding protein
VSLFVDTNLLVYAYDRGAGPKQQVAAELIAELASELVVSTQVLAEFYWVVTRRLDPPLAPAMARQAVDHLAVLPVVPTDAALVLRAIDTSQTHALALWDALIVEAAAAGGCAQLLTEDMNPGQIIRGVELVNPFEPGVFGNQ